MMMRLKVGFVEAFCSDEEGKYWRAASIQCGLSLGV
jgi:hypothetical protein